MSFQPNEQLTAQQSESVDPPGVAAGLDLHTAALLRVWARACVRCENPKGLAVAACQSVRVFHRGIWPKLRPEMAIFPLAF